MILALNLLHILLCSVKKKKKKEKTVYLPSFHHRTFPGLPQKAHAHGGFPTPPHFGAGQPSPGWCVAGDSGAAAGSARSAALLSTPPLPGGAKQVATRSVPLAKRFKSRAERRSATPPPATSPARSPKRDGAGCWAISETQSKTYSAAVRIPAWSQANKTWLTPEQEKQTHRFIDVCHRHLKCTPSYFLIPQLSQTWNNPISIYCHTQIATEKGLSGKVINLYSEEKPLKSQEAAEERKKSLLRLKLEHCSTAPLPWLRSQDLLTVL